ncbi:hypothetical protein BHE90_003922 [Fusarium euwallaceae]|uniref:Uncharacterized protein n=1 Tax=Fusarium euwallaceae TaxID=1147111 RepID=A0A430M0U1_9HYPO|nr:hypothetical protein BHE90_003922 [Fusarium euwallaceae]
MQYLSHLIRKGTGEDIPMRTPWSYVLSARALADRSKLGIFLTHMENLYKSQGREMRFVFSRAGHRPELPPWFDFTALYEKAARGHMIDSDEFRKLRIFFNVRDIYGLTPLLYAAGTKNCQLIDQLLNMGADPTLADFRGYTVARHVYLSGCLHSLRKLYVKRALDKQAMSAQAMNGLRLMYLAAGKGNCNIIKSLRPQWLPETRDMLSRLGDFGGSTAAHWATTGGHNQVAELLRADVT